MGNPFADELIAAKQGDPKLRELTWRVITGTVTDASVDPPTISTDGSLSIATPILGGAVVLDDDPVLILSARGTRIVLGKAGRQSGWEHIDAGSVSAQSSWTINVPATTFKRVRVTHHGTVASGGPIGFTARVNGDTTASLHRSALSTFHTDQAVTSLVTGTSWSIGFANEVQGTTIELLISNADALSAVPFQSVSTAWHTAESTMRHALGSGNLASTRTISSIEFGVASSTFTGDYTVEGYRVV